MLYIVASHSFLIAVDVDANWKLQHYEVINTGYHYGVAVLENGQQEHSVYNDGKHLIVYRGGKSDNGQTEPQLMLYKQTDHAFERVGSIDVGQIGDVHQIACANGGAYITNTEYNALIFHDFENDKQHDYAFENKRFDKNHVNSVYPCGNQIFALLHNRRQKESQIVVLRHDRSKGFALEHTLSLWDENCHNVFLDDKRLMYNASLVNRLVVVDLEKDRILKKWDFSFLDRQMPSGKGHVKGLSVTKDHIVVAISEETARHLRPTSLGYLVALDRHSLSLISTVDLQLPDLPHPIGNINEVRCLDEGELSHARMAPSSTDWSTVKMVKRNPLLYAWRRMKGGVLGPVFRMKRFLQDGKQ